MHLYMCVMTLCMCVHYGCDWFAQPVSGVLFEETEVATEQAPLPSSHEVHSIFIYMYVMMWLCYGTVIYIHVVQCLFAVYLFTFTCIYMYMTVHIVVLLLSFMLVLVA